MSPGLTSVLIQGSGVAVSEKPAEVFQQSAVGASQGTQVLGGVGIPEDGVLRVVGQVSVAAEVAAVADAGNDGEGPAQRRPEINQIVAGGFDCRLLAEPYAYRKRQRGQYE